jgi:hypothetical protein
MRKNCLLSLVFVAMSLSSNAQSEFVQVKWGPEHETEERYAPSQVVGVEKDGFYVWETDIKMFGNKTHYLEYYSKDRRQIKKDHRNLFYEQKRDFMALVFF